MEYTTVTASKPGVVAPRIEKRTSDSKIFLIDCSPLLCTHELVLGDINYTNSALNVSEAKTNQGKYIKFRVSGGPTNVPYTDYLINFSVGTTMTNVLTVPVSIRVYSN
jgi:hypothetical protein